MAKYRIPVRNVEYGFIDVIADNIEDAKGKADCFDGDYFVHKNFVEIEGEIETLDIAPLSEKEYKLFDEKDFELYGDCFLTASVYQKNDTVWAEKGYEVGNIDATVLAEEPKLAPYIPQMCLNIARALEVELDRISVKATTEEGLGFTGAGFGIAAHAVCLLEKLN